jgi:hypothetical protein
MFCLFGRVVPAMVRPKIHKRATYGRRFYLMDVGDAFECTVEEYPRYHNARTHFMRKHEDVVISSGAIRDEKGRTVGFRFWRSQ